MCGVSVSKDIYVLDQFLKYLFDKHFNMGVINVPQSLANQLHLWIWHTGNQVYDLASVFIPLTLFSLQHSVSVNPLIFLTKHSWQAGNR